MRERGIIIVGGGFSGLATAAHLLRRAKKPLRVLLIERTPPVGRGVAYGTRSRVHQLNVPAGKMSLFPDDPAHFVRWLRKPPETFARRKDYSRYLAWSLKEAARGARPGVRLEIVRGEVVAARPSRGGAQVSLADGRSFRGDRVVLATGHLPSAHPTRAHERFYAGARYIRDPWTPGALDAVGRKEAVLLVGTGLTMVDQALALSKQGHQGRLFALSRRGLLPLSHAPHAPHAPLSPRQLPRSARALLHDVRRRAALAAGRGEDWRAVVDSLRPATQRLWGRLSDAERRRFLRHMRPFWDVHRHRVAPEVGRALDALVKTGRLKVLAGRVENYRLSPRGVAVRVRPRGGERPLSLRVARVINCTGPELDYARANQPLAAGLRGEGLLLPHALRLGASIKGSGALIGKTGRASKVFFMLGPSRTGLLWESVAVPELRGQAEALAQALLR